MKEIDVTEAQNNFALLLVEKKGYLGINKTKTLIQELYQEKLRTDK